MNLKTITDFRKSGEASVYARLVEQKHEGGQNLVMQTGAPAPFAKPMKMDT